MFTFAILLRRVPAWQLSLNSLFWRYGFNSLAKYSEAPSEKGTLGCFELAEHFRKFSEASLLIFMK